MIGLSGRTVGMTMSAFVPTARECVGESYAVEIHLVRPTARSIQDANRDAGTGNTCHSYAQIDDTTIANKTKAIGTRANLIDPKPLSPLVRNNTNTSTTIMQNKSHERQVIPADCVPTIVITSKDDTLYD